MIEALGYRLTIRPDKVVDSEAEKTKEIANRAGIVIPDKIKEDLDSQYTRERASVDQGVVIGVGSTAFNGDPWCVAGDRIAYARHAGKFIKDPDSGEDILVINDDDVICRITEKVAKDD